MGRKKKVVDVVDVATIIKDPEKLKDVLANFKAIYSEKDEAKLHTSNATELFKGIVEHYQIEASILKDAFNTWSDEHKAQIKSEGTVLADALKELNSQ